MDEPELTCEDCGLRYNVVWSLDAMGQGPDGVKPVHYCPRCGSQDITLPESETEA